MSSKKIVDLLKQIVQFSQTTTGFAQNLKHVSHENISEFCTLHDDWINRFNGNSRLLD